MPDDEQYEVLPPEEAPDASSKLFREYGQSFVSPLPAMPRPPISGSYFCRWPTSGTTSLSGGNETFRRIETGYEGRPQSSSLPMLLGAERSSFVPVYLCGWCQNGTWHVEMPEKLATYRLYAAECAELAQQITDPERRLVLVKMAQSWLALADLAEKRLAQQASSTGRGDDDAKQWPP